MLRRDIRVARRELPFFLVRTAMQPLLLMIVFGYLMPKLGVMQKGYTATLLPGVLALSLALSSVQSVALPMVAQFGFSKEIEDRLLAPIPNHLVALELIVAGTIQGMIAGIFVLPAGRLIMGAIPGLALSKQPVHHYTRLIIGDMREIMEYGARPRLYKQLINIVLDIWAHDKYRLDIRKHIIVGFYVFLG